MSIYTDQGYLNRKDYLLSLSEDLGIDSELVFSVASLLGSTEDFDGLITTLEDYAEDF